MIRPSATISTQNGIMMTTVETKALSKKDARAKLHAIIGKNSKAMSSMKITSSLTSLPSLSHHTTVRA
ncbi:hypothetical protein IJG01_00130 [Candidatus Saccharibacteria bacterium]|nr:hypothetical protein [Candidatus Saccharibacteria bacterium]